MVRTSHHLIGNWWKFERVSRPKHIDFRWGNKLPNKESIVLHTFKWRKNIFANFQKSPLRRTSNKRNSIAFLPIKYEFPEKPVNFFDQIYGKFQRIIFITSLRNCIFLTEKNLATCQCSYGILSQHDSIDSGLVSRRCAI